MRRSIALTLAALLVVALAGCGPSSAGPAGNTPGLPAPPDTSTWKQVGNLDYLNWKKFPVGTAVVRTATTHFGENFTTSVETYTLKEVSDREVTVERQNTTFRSDGSYRKVNEPDLRKVTDKVIVHPTLDPAALLKPDPQAKESGREKVSVLGTDYECTVYKWTNSTESGPMAVTLWLCDDLPGRVAKQEMTVSAAKNYTRETVTEWRKPN